MTSCIALSVMALILFLSRSLVWKSELCANSGLPGLILCALASSARRCSPTNWSLAFDMSSARLTSLAPWWCKWWCCWVFCAVQKRQTRQLVGVNFSWPRGTSCESLTCVILTRGAAQSMTQTVGQFARVRLLFRREVDVRRTLDWRDTSHSRWAGVIFHKKTRLLCCC